MNVCNVISGLLQIVTIIAKRKEESFQIMHKYSRNGVHWKMRRSLRFSGDYFHFSGDYLNGIYNRRR